MATTVLLSVTAPPASKMPPPVAVPPLVMAWLPTIELFDTDVVADWLKMPAPRARQPAPVQDTVLLLICVLFVIESIPTLLWMPPPSAAQPEAAHEALFATIRLPWIVVLALLRIPAPKVLQFVLEDVNEF